MLCLVTLGSFSATSRKEFIVGRFKRFIAALCLGAALTLSGCSADPSPAPQVVPTFEQSGCARNLEELGRRDMEALLTCDALSSLFAAKRQNEAGPEKMQELIANSDPFPDDLVTNSPCVDDLTRLDMLEALACSTAARSATAAVFLPQT